MYINYKRTRYNRFIHGLRREEKKRNEDKGHIKWSIAEVRFY